MKFLILTKAIGTWPTPEEVLAGYKAAKEYLNAMVADGTLDCVYTFADGVRGVAIGNADSHEELWGRLRAYPQDRFIEYEIHPVVDSRWAFDNVIESLRKRMSE